MVSRHKNDVFVYVEGGGDSDELKSECRRAFREFFAKTDLGTTRRPRVVACGSRNSAYDSFDTAITQGKNALLLVDSEAPVAPANQVPGKFNPWAHLLTRDNWTKPASASNDNCHLMAQCMESWFIADWDTTAKFFKQGFDGGKKPSGAVESVAKQEVYSTLELASKNCKTKAPYGKGAHSFKLLAMIKPKEVMEASPWAKRFIDELIKRKP